jgi:hypothetical protein
MHSFRDRIVYPSVLSAGMERLLGERILCLWKRESGLTSIPADCV